MVSNMKKNKSKKTLILTIIGVILLVVLLIFILNYSKDDATFSLIEKKWITDNENNVIDVSIYNDVPVFGESGQGIAFDYLESFTEKYNINFNKVSYLSSDAESYKNVSFKILNSDDKLENSDILLYEDAYVVVSLNTSGIDKISDLSNLEIGVLEEDLSLVSYYLVDAKEVKYTPYKSANELFTALSNDDIKYAIIPQVLYLDDILKNDLNILFHISDLKQKYVLSVKDNETLLNILKKYNVQVSDDFKEMYDKNLLSATFKYLEITEAEKSSYNSSTYTYGYVVNMPYENSEDSKFVGTISNYLSGFEDTFDVDFKMVEYDTIKDLRQALSNGEVDLVFSNFNVDGTNVDKIYSISPLKEEYVIISKKPFVVDSVRSLKDKEVYVVSNTYLHDYLVSNNVNTKGFNNTDDLLKNIDNNSIVALDVNTYRYYQDQKLLGFKELYVGLLNQDYKFTIRDVNKNTTFSKLFTTYVSIVNYNDIKYNYNTTSTISNVDFLKNIVKYLIIILFFIMGIVILMAANRKRKKEKIGKDNKMKFIDVMTSLKNRNYLNLNLEKWGENKVYPQSVIVIDLNNIKEINDSHGHEEGDNEIKKAASILINNQLEKTDIIRTDGNEFLIYMIGYEEKEVVAYSRKLYKELKELPHKYGASIGYSMIIDELKTIEDAINEATIMMRDQKKKK